jgi:anti-sigma factor RsiW
MHQPIRDHLEAYLTDPGDPSISEEFHSHLADCNECAAEIQAFSMQSELFGALRAPQDAEPAPGFYAHVLARIEEQRGPDSFWSLFLDPAFGRRLAFACAAFVLLMGTYLLSTEPGNSQHLASPTGVVSQDRFVSSDDSIRPQQRDAVLVNLVSFRE